MFKGAPPTLAYATQEREWISRRPVELIWAIAGLSWRALELPFALRMTCQFFDRTQYPLRVNEAALLSAWSSISVLVLVACVCVMLKARPLRLLVFTNVATAAVLCFSELRTVVGQVSNGLLAWPPDWAAFSNVAAGASYTAISLSWPSFGLLLYAPLWLGERRERRAADRAAFDAEEFAKLSTLKSTDPAPSASADSPRP